MKNILPRDLVAKEISLCLMPGKWIVLCRRPKRSEWVKRKIFWLVLVMGKLAN